MEPVSPGQIPGLAKWVRDGVRWIATRVMPDHASVGQLSLRPNQFAMSRHFVYAAVAPSRSGARPFDDRSVRRAMAFAGRVAPGAFSAEPQISDGHKSLFYTESDDGVRERELAVDRTGLVELLWSVSLRSTPDEGLLLPATAVVRPLLMLAAAVGTQDYAELSGLHAHRRHFGKVDWSFMMTCAARPNGVRETWSAIEFPGTPPPRAGAQHGGEFPPHGVGWRSLRRSAGRGAVSGFLRELLVANGYHELRDVVARTLAVADDERSAAAGGASS